MESTRILLVALPRMLEEIVRDALVSRPDMEVAGAIRNADGLARKVSRIRPDIVIVGRDDPALTSALLERSPRVQVIAVGAEGRDASVYALRPERTRLGALSPAELVEAVGAASRRRGADAWWSR